MSLEFLKQYRGPFSFIGLVLLGERFDYLRNCLCLVDTCLEYLIPVG